MSMRTRDQAATSRSSPRSFRVGESEIRPIRGATPVGEGEGRERTGIFVPGGSYRLDRFPALKRLMHDWEGRE